jgi:hypothetical protein
MRVAEAPTTEIENALNPLSQLQQPRTRCRCAYTQIRAAFFKKGEKTVQKAFGRSIFSSVESIS